MKKGFTLLEVMVVSVILGILATIALPVYNTSRERIFDNQAKADLKLMWSAEKNYYLDMQYYYPSTGSITDLVTINNALTMDLPANVNKRWNYSVFNTGCCQASRTIGTKNWRIRIAETDPVSGTCP